MKRSKARSSASGGSDVVEKTKRGLIFDGKQLRKEFRLRCKDSVEKKIHLADENDATAAGWLVKKRYKQKRLLVTKLKGYEQTLEDRVWTLFYRMGYAVLNHRRLRVAFKRHDNTVGDKQIDVLAKDDETVLVVECKAREKRGRRSLQKDLAETKSFQGQIAETLKNVFGRESKYKIVWMYVTNNIIWSEPDVDRAAEINVRVVTENELQYYETFIRHIGTAGRFQFLAEFLRGQKIPELSNIRVPAVRGSLGGETYFSFVTTPRHLLKIAFVNHLALNHPDGRPAYQRMVSHSRLKKIGAFIQRGGYFPTNILINFTEKCRFDLISNKEASEESTKFGWLYLPDKYKSAWVIDGQHRLYGFSNLKDSYLDQHLFVLAFEKMSTKTEAELFITINHEQKSVPRAILIALQADLKWGSDDPKERIGALGSALVKSLNSDPTGVLFRRFAMEGSPESDNQSLTLAEIVKGLEQSKLLGRVAHGVLVPGMLSGATDEKTMQRGKRVLNGYFDYICATNVDRWNAGRQGHVCVNPGIRAHLRLIAEMLERLRVEGVLDPEEADETALLAALKTRIEPLLTWLRGAPDAEVAVRFARRFGEGGVKEYFYEICTIIAEKDPSFGPADFQEYRRQVTDQRRTQADSDVIDLTRRMTDYVIGVLKRCHGEVRMPSGELAYWELGIESARAKEAAFKRQMEEPDPQKRLPKEAYLDVLDIRDIVRQKNNWEQFKDVFNIPLPDEKGKTYYLQWMEEFNKLRRIPAHSSSLRVYSEQDYGFLEWLKRDLRGRLTAASKAS